MFFILPVLFVCLTLSTLMTCACADSHPLHLLLLPRDPSGQARTEESATQLSDPDLHHVILHSSLGLFFCFFFSHLFKSTSGFSVSCDTTVLLMSQHIQHNTCEEAVKKVAKRSWSRSFGTLEVVVCAKILIKVRQGLRGKVLNFKIRNFKCYSLFLQCCDVSPSEYGTAVSKFGGCIL